MSDYIHTAIIVSGSNSDGRIEDARKQAESLGLNTSDPIPGRNFFDSFMVAPSGAGDLHPSAEEHADRIAAFVEYLRQRIGLDWVEVKFGREHGPAKIVNDCGDAQSRAAIVWKGKR